MTAYKPTHKSHLRDIKISLDLAGVGCAETHPKLQFIRPAVNAASYSRHGTFAQACGVMTLPPNSFALFLLRLPELQRSSEGVAWVRAVRSQGEVVWQGSTFTCMAISR